MTSKAYYNSNLLITPLPHDETYGYWVSPGAEFAGKTERLEVSGRAAADFVSYYGGQETNFTNIFLPLSVRYKTERDVLGVTGGFTRDNTLMSELLTTGVVVRFTQRNQLNATPTWTRDLTEKVSLQSSFQFTDTTYENGLRLGLVDYQVFGGSVGTLIHLTEFDQVRLTGLYMNFHTTNGPFALRASFPGGVLEVTHAFTETLSATLQGGPRYIASETQSAGNSIRTRETVWLFGAGVKKQFESGSIQANISRDIVPSAFGLLVQTDRASVLVSYSLSERLTASLDGSTYLVTGATNIAGGGTLPDFRYSALTPKVEWKFLERWKMDLSYTYGFAKLGSIPDLGISNSAAFMLTYYPPKLAFSH